MTKRIKKVGAVPENRPIALGELIHASVREAIERAVHEELAVLGVARYERSAARMGYRNGLKERALTGPTGPLELTLPRAVMDTPAGKKEWTSTIVRRYQRRLREVNEAVVATYLAGGNTRRLRGALRPLLKAAPLSKSAVSRIVATLKNGLEAWRTRSLGTLDVVYLLSRRPRPARAKWGQGGQHADPRSGRCEAHGQKQLVALELCSGESFDAWKGCVDDLVTRGLKTPLLCIVDGNAGLRRAVELVWPKAAVQRCCVHKLRNLEQGVQACLR